MKKAKVTVKKLHGVTYHHEASGLTLALLKLSVGKYLMSLDLAGVQSIEVTMID